MDEEEYMLERYNANAGRLGGEGEEDDDADDEETDDEDNSEEDEEQQVFLLVGQSGHGKTTLSKDLIASIAPKGRPVLLVNDNTGKKPPRGWKKVDWEKLTNSKNSAVVVEDLVSTSKAQFDQLRSLLHFSNHHA